MGFPPIVTSFQFFSQAFLGFGGVCFVLLARGFHLPCFSGSSYLCVQYWPSPDCGLGGGRLGAVLGFFLRSTSGRQLPPTGQMKWKFKKRRGSSLVVGPIHAGRRRGLRTPDREKHARGANEASKNAGKRGTRHFRSAGGYTGPPPRYEWSRRRSTAYSSQLLHNIPSVGTRHHNHALRTCQRDPYTGTCR